MVIHLLAAGAIAIAVLGVIARREPKVLLGADRSTWYIASLLIVLTIGLSAQEGFYFASHIWNACAILVAIFGYCYVAFASFVIRPRLLGITLGLILVVPIALFPLTGLALGFILNDVSAPVIETQTANGLICQTYEYGMAVSDEGKVVNLIRPMYGIAYHKIFSRNVSYLTSTGFSGLSSPNSHGELCAFAVKLLQASGK